jgi:hypothetical protein
VSTDVEGCEPVQGTAAVPVGAAGAGAV